MSVQPASSHITEATSAEKTWFVFIYIYITLFFSVLELILHFEQFYF